MPVNNQEPHDALRPLDVRIWTDNVGNGQSVAGVSQLSEWIDIKSALLFGALFACIRQGVLQFATSGRNKEGFQTCFDGDIR